MALYLEHFGLAEPPFRITPHTDFFFDGADRGATLDALIYAIVHDEGIVKVSGEVGSGKTMLCRVLMERLPAHVETLYLATPSLARDEILHAIGDELDLKLPEGRTSVALRELQEQLIRLYAAGRRVVVLIDEAHVMPDETLEQVRLLSNLETNRHKLLQIVLFGQPELDATLAQTTLRQLRDRITNSFRMRPLSEAEVAKYVSFRMRAAGYRGPDVFMAKAVSLITRASGGLTRRINILADKSLLAAFTENSHAVADKQVRAAIADSEFAPLARPKRPLAYIGGAVAIGVLAGIALQWTFLAPLVPPKEISAVGVPTPPIKAFTPTNAAVTAVDKPEVLGVKQVEMRSEPPGTTALGSETPAQRSETAQPPEVPAPAPTAPKPEPIPQLAREQQRRFAGYSAAGQKLLAGRLDATREMLERNANERYALELFITDNSEPARMERFLQRARDLVPIADMFVIPSPMPGGYRLRVVYGDFASREEALAAARRLPPRYQEAFKAVPRSVAELRSQI